MNELDKNELNKVAGGMIDIPQDGSCRVEIREENGRKLAYVYDKDGNFVMVQDITEDKPVSGYYPTVYDYQSQAPYMPDMPNFDINNIHF